MKTINHTELKTRLGKNEDFVFLNVLSQEYYEQEHIPGSENIPYDADDFVEQVKNKTSSKNDEVIVYCANESCDASDKAVARLEEAGFTNVKDFKGGTEKWKQAGYEIEGRKEAA